MREYRAVGGTEGEGGGYGGGGEGMGTGYKSSCNVMQRSAGRPVSPSVRGVDALSQER
jgi:hypothetical protein